MTVARHWCAGLGRTWPPCGEVWDAQELAPGPVRPLRAGAQRMPVVPARGERWRSVVVLLTAAVVLAVAGGGWSAGTLVACQLGVAVGMVGSVVAVERTHRRPPVPPSSSQQECT